MERVEREGREEEGREGQKHIQVKKTALPLIQSRKKKEKEGGEREERRGKGRKGGIFKNLKLLLANSFPYRVPGKWGGKWERKIRKKTEARNKQKNGIGRKGGVTGEIAGANIPKKFLQHRSKEKGKMGGGEKIEEGEATEKVGM